MIIVKKKHDNHRFMQSKLSDLVDNLSEINKKECLECKGKCEVIGFKLQIQKL